MLSSQHKLVISGLVVEHYYYRDNFVSYGYHRHSANSEKKEKVGDLYLTEEQILDKKRQGALTNKLRTKRRVHRIIDSNIYQYHDQGKPITPKFVTLTFGTHITDIKKANRIYSKYIQRLNYLVYGKQCADLKYLNVIEFQKSGRIHYHALFFNLPFIQKDLLEKTWTHGFAQIKSVVRVRYLAAYMTKYMTKGFEEEKLKGKRRYFTSTGLLQPLVIRDDSMVKAVIDSLPIEKKMTQKEMDSKYMGVIVFTEHHIAYKAGTPRSILLPSLFPSAHDVVRVDDSF